MLIDICFNGNNASLTARDVMTSAKVEKELEKIEYQKAYSQYRFIKDKKVEDAVLPPIVFAFYAYILLKERIPKPFELVNWYYRINDFRYTEDTVNWNGKVYSRDGINGRVLRSYPSLVRDYHFFLLLTESGLFDNVTYSFQEDRNGKDILIVQNGIEYQVSLFVATRRSLAFKEIKNTCRHTYENEIQVPLLLGDAQQCGDFYLYSQKDIDFIKTKTCIL